MFQENGLLLSGAPRVRAHRSTIAKAWSRRIASALSGRVPAPWWTHNTSREPVGERACRRRRVVNHGGHTTPQSCLADAQHRQAFPPSPLGSSPTDKSAAPPFSWRPLLASSPLSCLTARAWLEWPGSWDGVSRLVEGRRWQGWSHTRCHGQKAVEYTR